MVSPSSATHDPPGSVPEEVAGAVLATPLVLNGVARHGQAMAGRDAEQPALECRDGRGHVVLRHLAERHHRDDAQAEGRKAGRPRRTR